MTSNPFDITCNLLIVIRRGPTRSLRVWLTKRERNRTCQCVDRYSIKKKSERIWESSFQGPALYSVKSVLGGGPLRRPSTVCVCGSEWSATYIHICPAGWAIRYTFDNTISITERERALIICLAGLESSRKWASIIFLCERHDRFHSLCYDHQACGTTWKI